MAHQQQLSTSPDSSRSLLAIVMAVTPLYYLSLQARCKSSHAQLSTLCWPFCGMPVINPWSYVCSSIRSQSRQLAFGFDPSVALAHPRSTELLVRRAYTPVNQYYVYQGQFSSRSENRLGLERNFSHAESGSVRRAKRSPGQRRDYLQAPSESCQHQATQIPLPVHSVCM